MIDVPNADSRQGPRLPVSAPVTVQFSGDDEEYAAQLEDVSFGGARVAVRVPQPVARRDCGLTIRGASRAGIGLFGLVKFVGKLVWSKPADAPSPSTIQIGIQVTGAQSDVLSQAMDEAGEGPPAPVGASPEFWRAWNAFTVQERQSLHTLLDAAASSPNVPSFNARRVRRLIADPNIPGVTLAALFIEVLVNEKCRDLSDVPPADKIGRAIRAVLANEVLPFRSISLRCTWNVRFLSRLVPREIVVDWLSEFEPSEEAPHTSEDLLRKVLGECEQVDFDAFVRALSTARMPPYLAPRGSAWVFSTPSHDVQSLIDAGANVRHALAVNWLGAAVELRYPAENVQLFVPCMLHAWEHKRFRLGRKPRRRHTRPAEPEGRFGQTAGGKGRRGAREAVHRQMAVAASWVNMCAVDMPLREIA